MLSSITPLGERGRHNRFAVTASWFVAGALAGGASLGALSGTIGALVLPDNDALLLATLAALALAGAVTDAGVAGLRVPTIKRQVDERWLHKYRGWVYGAGFGAQLGAALTTIVSSAAVYVMVAAAMATRTPATGALIGVVFGAVRGSSIVLARRIVTTDQLRAFHRRLAANATRSATAAAASQAALALLAVVVVWSRR